MKLLNDKFDFYSPFNFSTYSLGQTMRYQLQVLENLDHLTHRHSEIKKISRSI